MKYRKQLITILIISLVLVSLVVLFGSDKNIVRIGFCEYEDSSCTYNVVESIFVPVELGFSSLFLVSLILLFTRESTYLSWRKFAMWAIPISAFILLIVPADTPGTWMGGGDLTKETASWGISILFLIISLTIIILRSIRPRNNL